MLDRTPLAALLAAALLCMAGCSGDDESSNPAPTPDAGAVDSGGTDAGDSSVELAMNYQFRFDDMFLSGSAAAAYDVLESIIRSNIDPSAPGVETPVLVLLDIVDLDADAGTFRIRAGSGVKTATAGEYAWDEATPDVYYDGSVDAETGVMSATIDEFIFIVNGLDDPPAQVPLLIRDLDFQARVSSNEGGEPVLSDGSLSGRIAQADIEGESIVAVMDLPAQALTDLLGTSNLDTDADSDGTNESWSLDSTFSAESTTIVE